MCAEYKIKVLSLCCEGHSSTVSTGNWLAATMDEKYDVIVLGTGLKVCTCIAMLASCTVSICTVSIVTMSDHELNEFHSSYFCLGCICREGGREGSFTCSLVKNIMITVKSWRSKW